MLRDWAMALFLSVAVWTTGVYAADPLHIGFGSHKPPYIFENERRGLEYELVAAAAKAAGFELVPYYAPISRLHLKFRHQDLEALAMMNRHAGVEGYLSDVYIHYNNMAVALAKRDLPIRRIADLAPYSVSTFQEASHLLGPEFEKMTRLNPHYREEARQINRNRLLYSGRIDVVVGDPLIIDYFNQDIRTQVDIRQPLRWYKIFPPTPYQVMFRQAQQRDRFNRGLAAIRADGSYAQIEGYCRNSLKNLTPQP